MLTRSEQAIVLVVVLAVAAGVIAGQAWPQQPGVPHSVAVFCLIGVAAMTAMVLHMRRGRP